MFRARPAMRGTEWHIIEYESDAYPPLVSVEKSLEVMRRWGKA